MDPIKDYYEYLKGAGADVAPTIDSFKNTLSDVNTAKQYYTYLRDNKFDTPDTFESFSNTLGIGKKKVGSTVSQASPSRSQSILAKAPEELPLGIPGMPSTKDLFFGQVSQAREKLNNTLQTRDDIYQRYIKDERLNLFDNQQRATKTLDGFVNPAAQTVKRDIVKVIPVTPEEVIQKKEQVMQDPVAQKEIIRRAAKKDPEIAKSAYLIDAEERAAKDPTKANAIIDNANKIASGELTYDIKSGRLQKPEGVLISTFRGGKERNRQLDDYDFFTKTMNRDAIISQLEADMKDYDPDRPVPVPEGAAASFGQMLGMEGIAMVKGAGAATITSLIPGAQVAAPYVAAFAASPEYYKRGYATALRQAYYEQRQKGVPESEALDVAQKQAEAEANYSAAEGFASGLIGARVGMKPSSLKVGNGFKNAVGNVVTSTGNFIKENIPEGLADASVAGGLQVAKNIEAINNGLDRGLFDGVQENVAGELGFAIGLGVLTKAGRFAVNPKSLNTIVTGIAQQPKEVVDAKLGEMVVTGQATPQEVVQAAQKIDEARAINSQIPAEITDEEQRAEIADRIKTREQLKKELSTANEVFHNDIKSKISAVDQEIINIVNTQRNATNESQVQEGRTKGNISQPQGVVQGQPEVGQGERLQGQAAQPQANVGDSNIGSQGKVAPGKRLFNDPNPEAAVIETEFKKSKGIDTPEPAPITKLDEERSKKIADAYEQLVDSPDDPEVQAAYQAMADETMDQFDAIAKSGVKVEIWTGKGEPYKNSAEMIADVRDNKHMYIFSTEEGFGDTPITDQQRQQNALLRDSGVKDVNGRPLLINDVFRFVHDYFGHTRLGNSFGAIGEENAWNVHARMYSPLARRAMTTETRGQNSWVNFNKSLRNPDGSIKKKSDDGYVPPAQRPFADQKMALLPEEFSIIEDKYSLKSANENDVNVDSNPEGFAEVVSKAKSSQGSNAVSMAEYSQEDFDKMAREGAKFYRTNDGSSVGVVKANGEIVSLVKNFTSGLKGAAQAILSKMKSNGGLFIENYDGYLTRQYEKAGFKVVARVPFDETKAQKGWDRPGSPIRNKPDVVFMVRNDLAPDQAQTFEDYDQAQNYTNDIINKAVAAGKAQTPVQIDQVTAAIEEAIPNAAKSLQAANIKFQVVDGVTQDAAQAARGNQAIFVSDEGTVIIDRSKIKNAVEAGLVVWHEASHPAMNIIRNTNKALYDAVVRGLNEAAKRNAGVAGALNWAQSQEQYDNVDTQNDEAIVETIGRINSGLIDVTKLDTGLRQKLIDFVNSIAKFFGIDPILNDTDLAAFKKTVSQVADALKTGRDIGEIVGAENINEFINKAESPEFVIGGNYALQARVDDSPINVYESKEVSKLPTVSLSDIHNRFEGKAVVINSDPTRVGELTLPSGKKIFMYGGPAYLSVKDNVENNVGFATTQLSKVKSWGKYVNELFGNKPGVTLVATQAPTSILSNSYALRYVMDAISMLPKSVLRSSDFKTEFFGKDLVLLKDAFGEKGYNEFVTKYKKADLSNPEVIDNMIAEMAYKVGDDNQPASFKARGAFVSNLLGGLAPKASLKGVEGDQGYVSKKPSKYISGQLFDRLGINAEKVIREIGEPSLVNLYMNDGKWGIAVSGFETDPNINIESVQDGGVKHPLFNAKFPGKNPFILDGAYEVNKMFKPVSMTGPSGKPYTKTAAQMLAGSMYVKGQPTQTETSFEYTTTAPAAARIQASAGNRDIINGFYSPIEDRINTFKQPKASVQKWKEIVGMKSDEAVFSGLADWLGGMKPDRQLSKEDVLKFMKDNRIEIKEVTKGTADIASRLGEIIDRKSEIENTANELAYKTGVFNERAYRDYLVNSDEYYNLEKEEQQLKKQSNESQTKYSEYQLPGGENYKEVLITVPNIAEKKYNDYKLQLIGKYGSDFKNKDLTSDEFDTLFDLNEARKNSRDFKSSHFDEYNIITHLRMNTRTDADGKKVLFLEEVQSDWGQKGKREGFAEAVNLFTEKDVKSIKQEGKLWLIDFGDQYEEVGLRVSNFPTEADAIKEALRKINDENDTLRGNVGGKFDVPKAPYVTNTNAWVKLGLKVALKEAVRQGADRIAWTTGDQQNDRYDLSKTIESIKAIRKARPIFSAKKGPVGPRVYTLKTKYKNGEEGQTDLVESELADAIGKDLADRIIADGGGEYSGLDLRVGGKGMKAFYGDANNTGIVGNVAKALVKELTGKEGTIVASKINDDSAQKNRAIETARSNDMLSNEQRQGLIANLESSPSTSSIQPAIDITPELRQSVQQGMPQFSVGGRSEEELRAEGAGKERNRALSAKFGNLDPETQAKIEEDATTYFQRPNKQTEKAVNDFIDGQNLVDMADYVLSDAKIPEVSKVWMAAEVAKRLNTEIAAATDQDTKDALTDKQAAIYNEFAKKATSLGQAVQAFIAFKNDPNAVEFFLPKILRQLKKNGVEDVTETQKADIVNMLREVSEAAPGIPKDKAIIKLSHYLGKMAPMKPIDLLQAIWYAKILSGVTTQATNFFANAFNTAFELPAVAIRIAALSKSPMVLAAGVKGFGSGVFKGLVSAADIVKTGVRSKEIDKYFSENPLEYFSWSNLGASKTLDYIPPVNFGAWKYVGRVLAATDALFSTANQEAVANMLAYAEGYGGVDGFKKANKILNNTPEQVKNAKAQAVKEGFKDGSLQWKRRVIEIVSQNRGEKLTTEADAIGKRITLNYDPEGWTKLIFDATVALQKAIPPVKMVIPFARIVANLTENALNYTPFGVVKAATGLKNPLQFSKSPQLSKEERIDLFAKFTIGMMALVAVASNVGEDDDDWFEITAGGSPDVQKKYELQKGGWRPYTITFKDGTKISYKDWPIAGILAGVGHMRDAKKYSFDDSTMSALYAYGFFLNFYDKSLLSGLQDLFGIIEPNLGRGKYAPESTRSERAKKYAAQQVKSVAVSNLSQQLGRLYSELVTGDPQRDAKTFSEVIYKDLPIVNDGIRPIIDVFGEPVKYNTTERLKPVYSTESDKLIKWLNENKLFVGVPQKKNIINADGSERPMTDDEYYEYRKLAGKEVKSMINEFMDGIKYPDQDIKEKMFDAAKNTARKIAYIQILEKYGFK